MYEMTVVPFTIMIELNLYRFRIGVYSGGQCKPRVSKMSGKSSAGNCIPQLDDDFNNIRFLSFILYLYYILILMLLTMSMILRMTNLPRHCHFPEITDHEFFQVHVLNVKILYVFLIWFLIKQVCMGSQTKKDAMLHSLSSICSIVTQ